MPTIAKYIEAVNVLGRRSISLFNAECVRTESGELFYFAGCRSVVFKMIHVHKVYSLKCYVLPDYFLKDRYRAFELYVSMKGLEFIPYSYLYDNELTVVERELALKYPVLVTNWIEGENLKTIIKKLCEAGDSEALWKLTDDVMAVFIRLLSYELIHGDLKFDNIMISDEGKIYIIDWDGFFIEAVSELPTSELGTIGFQHPSRDKEHYGSRVDDYSITLILLTMMHLAENPVAYFDCENDNSIFLNPSDIMEGKSKLYKKLSESWRYNPPLYKLLIYLSGENIEFRYLEDILIRMSGEDRLDLTSEEIIDVTDRYELRRIINQSNNLYGYISDTNRVVVDTIYGDATTFECEMAGVRVNNEWFFINARGHKISSIFSYIRDCSDGLYTVRCGDKWGYFNPHKREMVIPAIYHYAEQFINGIARVSFDGENYLYINK